MHSQIVVNPRFHRGTKIGKGGPVLAAKIGPGGPVFTGDQFFVTAPCTVIKCLLPPRVDSGSCYQLNHHII